MGKRTQERDKELSSLEVMSVRELAEYLRISVHTVYRLAEQGRLPGRKVGKHWRFHRDAIVAWLATHREEDALYSVASGGRFE
ncbi:Putative DNA-binding proteinA [bacterium HR16]|nr:Putative DNA-binding proteinA [bacterium HR16]